MGVIDLISSECPLLLETPAGQGTKVLAEGPDAFMGFVARFADPRLPREPGLMRRVLEQDARAPCLQVSSAPLGARVDRHAPPGHGAPHPLDCRVISPIFKFFLSKKLKGAHEAVRRA